MQPHGQVGGCYRPEAGCPVIIVSLNMRYTFAALCESTTCPDSYIIDTCCSQQLQLTICPECIYMVAVFIKQSIDHLTQLAMLDYLSLSANLDSFIFPTESRDSGPLISSF